MPTDIRAKLDAALQAADVLFWRIPSFFNAEPTRYNFHLMQPEQDQPGYSQDYHEADVLRRYPFLLAVWSYWFRRHVSDHETVTKGHELLHTMLAHLFCPDSERQEEMARLAALPLDEMVAQAEEAGIRPGGIGGAFVPDELYPLIKECLATIRTYLRAYEDLSKQFDSADAADNASSSWFGDSLLRDVARTCRDNYGLTTPYVKRACTLAKHQKGDAASDVSSDASGEGVAPSVTFTLDDVLNLHEGPVRCRNRHGIPCSDSVFHDPESLSDEQRAENKIAEALHIQTYLDARDEDGGDVIFSDLSSCSFYGYRLYQRNIFRDCEQDPLEQRDVLKNMQALADYLAKFPVSMIHRFQTIFEEVAAENNLSHADFDYQDGEAAPTVVDTLSACGFFSEGSPAHAHREAFGASLREIPRRAVEVIGVSAAEEVAVSAEGQGAGATAPPAFI